MITGKSGGKSSPFVPILVVAVLVSVLVLIRGAVSQRAEAVVAREAIQQRVDIDAAQTYADRLDQYYLSRLVSEANKPGQVHQALVGEAPEASNYTATIVIGRTRKDSDKVSWVHDKLYNIHEPQIYIVDDNTVPGPHLDVHHGREAAVYLKYIVDNYDKLQDITFFWHSDEVVWHNNLLMGWNSAEQINRMDRQNIITQGYVPSRCDHWPGCPSWLVFSPSKAEDNLDPHRLGSLFSTEIFSVLFPDVEEFPPYFAGTCCSQFAVSRDQIHSRPLEQYQRLLKFAVEYEDDEASGRVFEYTWPYIFTGRGSWCPSMQECYCKTYNFCMENPQNIEAIERWNSLRTRREEVQWQLKFIQEAFGKKQRMAKEQGASPDGVADTEHAFHEEINKLTDHLERLTQTTWQAREDIVHYWKLPTPPTGW